VAETTRTSPPGEPTRFPVWRYVLAGAAASAATWLIAQYVQNTREPWDSPYFLYRGTLLLAGILLGLPWPRPYPQGLTSAWAGAWAGQLPFILGSQFRYLGIIATAFGSLFVAGGVLIGTMFRRGLKRTTG